MKKNYTIQQRLVSATPPFFKKLQLFGAGLAALGTSLTQVSGMPVKLTTILISAGSTIALISQFAVSQTDSLNTKTNDDTK